MKRFVRRLLSHMAAAGAVLCLMGAEGQMKGAAAISGAETTNGPASGLTSSVTGSAAGKTSNSLSAGATGSIASKTTNSLTTGATGSVASKATHSLTTGATGSVASKTTHSLTTGATGSAAVTSKATVTLSPYAEELVKILKFDRQVAVLVKEVTSEHIQRLVGYDEDDYQIIAPGIAVAVPEDKTDRILALLRRKLVPLRYLPFVVEMNEGLKRDKIGIIKGTDQYEILRIMHTNGDQYGISNEDLVERLKEWEKIAPFTIIGADGDWVELEFRALPKDLKAFVADVYEFSPEAIEQGAGNAEELMKEIRKTNRLFLSWD